MDFLFSVISNIIANLAFWLFFGFVFWFILRIIQSRFLLFFGLNRNRQIAVYLSNMWRVTEEKPEGYVLSGHEFRAAQIISTLFGSISLRFPEVVRGLVDSFWIGSKLNITVTVSPISIKSGFHFANMIIFGGSPKNCIRRYYTQSGMVYLMLEGEQLEPQPHMTSKWLQPEVIVTRGQRKGEKIDGAFNFAIIEKLYDEEHGITVFMCLGYRSDSTRLAVEYLTRHWDDFRRRYGRKNFAWCLCFPMTDKYIDDYQEPVKIVRFPN